ncbi:MAG: DUF6326 family protein [Candidatus Thorarchaeota archaeon]
MRLHELFHQFSLPVQKCLRVVSILMIIPRPMIFLSLTLKAPVNRLTNITLGILNAGIALISGFTGDLLPFFMLYSFVEVLLLAPIVWYAWSWPLQDEKP